MGIEILSAVSEGMSLSLMVIEAIALIAALSAVAGFAIYLAGIGWLCFKEGRRGVTTPRAARAAPPPPECLAAVAASPSPSASRNHALKSMT
jgi:hypothetical protein